MALLVKGKSIRFALVIMLFLIWGTMSSHRKLASYKGCSQHFSFDFLEMLPSSNSGSKGAIDILFNLSNWSRCNKIVAQAGVDKKQLW